MRPAAPIRVLQVLTYDAVGGTENMVATLVEGADPALVEMEVATLDAPGPVAERLRTHGIAVHSLGGDGQLKALRRLAGVVRHGNYGVVNAYGFKSPFVARFLVRLLSRHTAFVSGVRGLHPSELENLGGPKSRLVLALERITSSLVDVYDANSRGALELLAANGIPGSKLFYIPNGIEASRWSSAHRNGTRVPVVLCVARFVPRKRQGDLVAAAGLLRARNLDFELVFVGDGPILPEVEAAATHLADRVRFTGSLKHERLGETLRNADIFCLCSAWEGMPGSVMEAMACELPVVGTDVNGISDLVVDGETGLLVPPGDPVRLADALARLIGDAGERRRMGDAGRRHIEESFSLGGMVRAKQKLYQRLAGVA